MSGCVLRARRKGFDPEQFLSGGALPGSVAYDDGFNLTICESEELLVQLRDAEAFLRENSEQCGVLSKQLAPETPVLDFGIWRREAPSQSVVFPSSLVRVAGRLGFQLEVSIYEASDL